MEFKGIAWAGNLYQKFEAMCLELEEVMYQDTVTYLENQVQTVGASVKKFYSEVVEDFQPPSSIDPVKVAAAELPLNRCSHIGVMKKPKKYIPEVHKEVRTKKMENCEVIADPHAEHAASISKLDGVVRSPVSDGDLLVNGCSEFYSRKRKNGGLYRRPTAISKGSGIQNHLKKMSGTSTAVSRNPSRVSSFREMKKEVPSAPVKANDNSRLTEEEVCTSTSSHDTPASDTNISLETVSQKQDISGSTTTTTDMPLKNLDSDTQTEPSPCTEDMINTITSASGGEDNVLTSEGRPYNSDKDVVSNVVEPGVEIVERLCESKFEETCVLVEENEVYVASQKEPKHKSYKKKIREAFTSKMRSTRKQEYEKLAAQHSIQAPKLESSTSLIPTSSEDSDQEKWEKLQAIPDSEWELL